MVVLHEHGDREVVGHDRAIEAQFVAQQFGQDGMAASAGEAIDGGIGVHDRRQPGIANDGGERFGVDLA